MKSEHNIYDQEEVLKLSNQVISNIKSNLSSDDIQSCELQTWDKIMKKTSQRDISKKHLLPWLWGIAAAVAVIVILISNQNTFPFASQEEEWLSINTPMGKIDSLQLADGTKVILSGGSCLYYPRKFEGKQRMVKFNGEGYFNVAKDKKHPFVVKSSFFDVRVLGTCFNMKVYKDDLTSEVTLESGHIRIEDYASMRKLDMEPLSKIVYLKDSQSYKKEAVDKKMISLWRHNIYSFESECFADIAQTLERNFGVTINITKEELKQRRFTSMIEHPSSATEILDIFKLVGGFEYVLEKNNVITIK